MREQILNIVEVSREDSRIRLDLLRLADPAVVSIDTYPVESRVLLGDIEGSVVAVALFHVVAEKAELLNLAIDDAFQKRGLGTVMISNLCQLLREDEVQLLEVGTGNSSLGQLAFYQRNGFRISGVRRDFFCEYDPPIYENGIRCLDMVMLSIDLRSI